MHLSKTAKFSVIQLGAPPPGAASAAKAVASPTVAPNTPRAAAPSASSGLDVDGINAAVTKQQSQIKAMKKSGASADEVAAATVMLESLRQSLAAAQANLAPEPSFPRKGTITSCLHLSQPLQLSI